MSEARQIQSMIDFIEREAQEKAEELDSAAQEEYDVEKMRLVEAEKNKIRADTDKKKKQVDVDRRVANANYTKAQRLRVMQERAKIMEQLHESTRKKIAAKVADPGVYKQLLTTLLRQSLLSLKSDAMIKCRQEDVADVKALIPELTKWYQQSTGDSITIQTSKDMLDSAEALGGVVATSMDGRIVCNNTLANRTTTCFTELLPTVRYHLFNPDAPAEDAN